MGSETRGIDGAWHDRGRREAASWPARRARVVAAALDAVELRLFGAPLAAIYERMAAHAGLARLAAVVEERHGDAALSHSVAARECALEKNYLNVRLRRRTGFTFHRLLTRRRLLRAAELLVKTGRPIDEVSRACGFGSRNSFERNFSRHLGLPPGRFRRTVRAAPVPAADSLPAGSGPGADS